MKYGRNQVVLLGMAGVLVMSSMTGCGTVDKNEIVATVGEDQIPYGMANFYARKHQAQYETYYAGMMGMTGEEIWQQSAKEKGKTYEDTVKEELLLSLENLYLMKQHAGEYEVLVTEDETKKIKEAAKIFDEDNALEEKEAVSGFQQYVEEYLRMLTIQKKMEMKMKTGVNEEVSDEEAAQKRMKYVYRPYTKTDEKGNQVDLREDERQVLKEEMEAFLANVNASEEKDLDTLAAEVGYKVQQVTFDENTKSPDGALIQAADALTAEGDLTGVISSDYGIYVGKVVSFLDREATDAKKAEILEERKQAQIKELLEKWRAETKIEEDIQLWERIDFQKLGVTVKDREEKYDDSPAAY